MKSLFETVCVLMASATCATAFAGGPAEAGRTRAEVRAELQAALDSGWRPPSGEAQYQGALPVQSQRSRAQVQGEVLAALANGEQLPRGEAQPQQIAQSRSGLRREEVRGELMAALDAGWRPPSGEASLRPMVAPTTMPRFLAAR